MSIFLGALTIWLLSAGVSYMALRLDGNFKSPYGEDFSSAHLMSFCLAAWPAALGLAVWVAISQKTATINFLDGYGLCAFITAIGFGVCFSILVAKAVLSI